MIVMKFGGSSLATADRIRAVGAILRERLTRSPILVVSAIAGVTDLLGELAQKAAKGVVWADKVREKHVKLADELEVPQDAHKGLLDELEVLLQGISMVKELTPRTLDYVLSFGERLSARLVAAWLQRQGIASVAVDAFDVGLTTDANFGAANPLAEAAPIISWNIRRLDRLPVITGYIGKDKNGNITTLGRNGSDYTAAILGAALGAEEIQIWSDTDGVMTADPEIIPEARPIREMSFAEASELSYYGGRLHPSTLIPAVRKGIPVCVLNTLKPSSQGTLIVSRARAEGPVKSVVYKRNLFLINIVSTRMLEHSGFMEKIFEIFARYQIVIDMIATSEVSVSLTTDSDRNLDLAVKDLRQFAEVTVERDKALLCVVGEGIRSTPGIAGDVFSALQRESINVEMISFGATKINIALLVDEKDIRPAVRALHNTFFPHSVLSEGARSAPESKDEHAQGAVPAGAGQARPDGKPGSQTSASNVPASAEASAFAKAPADKSAGRSQPKGLSTFQGL